MVTPADARTLVERSRDEPGWFFDNVLGVEPYAKQLEIVDALRDNQRVAVVGCNGSGKDWMSARIMLWWQSVHYPAITVVLGPTHRQVSDIVWKEARSSFLEPKFPLGGRMYQTARWEHDDRHYALGLAVDNDMNLQGFHSPNLLVIITEAHNVSQSHIDAVKRLNPAKILLTGNAFANGGEFFEAFHGGAGLYKTIEISAFDTPNIIEGSNRIPGMVTREQIEERRREWGEESAMYIASILGRFPDNLGGQCRMIWNVQGRDTQQVAGQLKAMAEDDPDVDTIIVDDTGVGGGVTDRLNEETVRGGLVRVAAFNGGEKARRSDRYVNAIAEAWMEMSQAFRDGLMDIDDNPSLVAQLSSRRYIIQGDRRIKLESKDDFKKRARSSPDDADALAMSFGSPGPGVGVW